MVLAVDGYKSDFFLGFFLDALVTDVECKALERLLLRLDITMQPLIQDIFSQVIDSSPFFPVRFCDFSCMRLPFKTKQKVLSLVNSFWPEIYKKCQKWF